MAHHVKVGDGEPCGRADENVGREMRAGGYAREADGRSQRVGDVRHPFMMPVALRENVGHGKRHHGVTGGKTAAFTEKGIVRREKRVVVSAVWREFRGPRSSCNGFQNDHQYRVICDRLARQQARPLAVRIVAKQTDSVKAYRNYRYDHAADRTLEHLIVFAKYIGLPHLTLERRVLLDEQRGSTHDDRGGNPILPVPQLQGKKPHLFLIMQKSCGHLAPGNFQIRRIRCGIRTGARAGTVIGGGLRLFGCGRDLLRRR